MGCGITVGVFYLVRMIETNDSSTIYVLHHAIPALFFSLFIYGLFPLICQKVGLVDETDHIDLNDPANRK